MRLSDEIEGVILTGGASRRMGLDKASMEVCGEPLALRVARELSAVAGPVTIIGREPIAGYSFLEDSVEFAGPHAALKRFTPSANYVFVASCDLPLFKGYVVEVFRRLIDDVQAVVPILDGHHQPTCSLYGAAAFEALREAYPEERSLKSWLRRLKIRTVDEPELVSLGVNPDQIRGCNTTRELEELLLKGLTPEPPA